MNRKCPCQKCICLAMCRNKPFGMLFRCEILREYLPTPYQICSDRTEKVPIIEGVLKPTQWYSYWTYHDFKGEPQQRDLFVCLDDKEEQKGANNFR